MFSSSILTVPYRMFYTKVLSPLFVTSSTSIYGSTESFFLFFSIDLTFAYLFTLLLSLLSSLPLSLLSSHCIPSRCHLISPSSSSLTHHPHHHRHPLPIVVIFSSSMSLVRQASCFARALVYKKRRR
ncbi:hypothetical protein L228DRAFT_60958 [Xylona heveae TC161]|uniref:Uncharacterized protein n=1 Tax=Xylona heveae (strain CBS 132557 / TC161) TaxID=1328760 RepID=A0A165ILH7_XYLHT|nr:hypothetical protein L228DRAFT_60958 [Xylona heveae TC161]KZF25066.1 hypothetical protein L228DRAFT_60958 [Xylona heveae TC161]